MNLGVDTISMSDLESAKAKRPKVIFDSEDEEAEPSSELKLISDNKEETEPECSTEEEESDDNDTLGFVLDEAKGGGKKEDNEEEDGEYESDFICDEEEVAQGGVDMRDSDGEEFKIVTLSLRDLYTGTHIRIIYKRDDGCTAYADVRVPPRTPPGMLLTFRNFEIKVCYEPAFAGNFTVTDDGHLCTKVRVGQLDAVSAPETLTVHTPDDKVHTVECGMALITGDVIPAPGLGFGTADMLCDIQVVADRLSREQRTRLRDFIKTIV